MPLDYELLDSLWTHLDFPCVTDSPMLGDMARNNNPENIPFKLKLIQKILLTINLTQHPSIIKDWLYLMTFDHILFFLCSPCGSSRAMYKDRRELKVRQ